VFFYEGGDEQALVVFRDPDEAEAEVPGTGMTWRILGDAVGADEQLQPRRSGRNQPRDLHEEEEFESEADSDYEEEQIPRIEAVWTVGCCMLCLPIIFCLIVHLCYVLLAASCCYDF